MDAYTHLTVLDKDGIVYKSFVTILTYKLLLNKLQAVMDGI